MKDTYNVAIKYLQGKYGKKHGFTCSFENRLRKINKKKDRDTMLKNATDQDYNILVNPDLIDKKSNDWEIWLLVNQYHYGQHSKQELENKLKEHGIKK